jgi:hypothetical protein
MPGRRPDIVNQLPDGGREEIKFRFVWGPARPVSQIRRVFDREGRLLEVWHDAFDHSGAERHSHRIYRREEES